MKFRKAKKSDAQRLFEWRNDPLTRASSLTTEPIVWSKHLEWLKKTLRNPEREILIAVNEGGSETGTVRFDKLQEDGSIELSWTVAPEWRGKGVGKEIVTAALALPFAVAKKVRARIKSDNVASQRIAQAVGFCFQSEHEGLGEWYLAVKTERRKK